MTSFCALALSSRPGGRLLTRRWNWQAKARVLELTFNVSRANKLLIFCIYGMQSLDLFLNFVRISATNLLPTERFCCVSIELFVPRQQRFRGRSVAKWQ
jgi:hypothetical protein